MPKFLLPSVLTIIFLSGCATKGQFVKLMTSYVGQTDEAFVTHFGAPKKTYEINTHKKILTYSWDNDYAAGAPGYMNKWCESNITVNDGIIEEITYKGNWCVSKFPSDSVKTIHAKSATEK